MTKYKTKPVIAWHHVGRFLRNTGLPCLLIFIAGMLFYRFIVNTEISPDRIYHLHKKDTVVIDGSLYQLAINEIKKCEGMILSPIMDTAGKYYIGYGHQITYKDSSLLFSGIKKVTADTLLDNDFISCINSVRKHTGAVGGELLAMSMLMYNMGEGAFLESTVFYLYIRGEKKKARDAFIIYDSSYGIKLKGLKKRRKYEMDLFYK